MLFRNFIKVQQDTPEEIIVRQTKYILWMLIVCFVLTIGLISIMIIGALRVRAGAGGGVYTLINSIIGTSVLIFGILLWIVIIKQLIKFFYNVTIITSDDVIKITFDLFFKEQVKVIELYRILSIASIQNGILRTILNYGQVVMKVQNSGTISLRAMPKPKKIVSIIEQFKERITKERFQSNPLEPEEDI